MDGTAHGEARHIITESGWAVTPVVVFIRGDPRAKQSYSLRTPKVQCPERKKLGKAASTWRMFGAQHAARLRMTD